MPDRTGRHGAQPHLETGCSALRAKCDISLATNGVACLRLRDPWPGGAFVRLLQGLHSGVVGLPLYETMQLLEGAGYPVIYTLMNTPSTLA
jgi:hypothetical protein